MCVRAYVLCVYKRWRSLAYVHLSALTRTISLLPPLIPNPSRPLSRPPREPWRSHCFMLSNLHVLTPHKPRSAPPYHTSFMVYVWYRADLRALHSMYAFLHTVRRKHDRKDEPSKSLSYVKRETFLFWCSVSFLIPSPRFIWHFHSAPVYRFFFFFFLLMTVLFFPYLFCPKWKLRARRRRENSSGCSLEFPACCRACLRACPVLRPPWPACPPRPAPSRLRIRVCCVCVCVCVCAWAGCLGKPLTQLREEMSNRPNIVCKCVCVCVCLYLCVCACVMCTIKEAPVPCDRQLCCVYLTPLTSGGFLVCVRCCSPRPAAIGRQKLLLFL